MLVAGGRDRVQSMALLEWLDEAYPDAPLLPPGIEDRYTARELAFAIATELHAPLNLPVLKYLKDPLGHSQAEIEDWRSEERRAGKAGVRTCRTWWSPDY